MTLAAPLLTTRQIAKTFDKTRALDAVSIDVHAGEMIALIGASGSGKSTLLRSLAGQIAIDPGPGTIDGFGARLQQGGRITKESRSTRVRIAFIFQQFNLVGRLTLFTNACLGALGHMSFWRGVFGRWPEATRLGAMAALARVEMAEQAGRRAGVLSGGQQQRGALARALVQKADVILADEPVASLDPVSARRVMDILRELNRRDGLTVVVTLHRVDYALRYCDRVIALQRGRVVYDGSRDGLDHARLTDIYGPEFEDAYLEPARS
jgi:phosphonate transport system ATP-binding protein